MSEKPTAEAQPKCLSRYLAPLLVFVLAGAVFYPAVNAGFIGWDDDDLIRDNGRRLTFSTANLQWMATTSFFGHYHPLTWFSYAADQAAWNGDPRGFHLTNIILHALTALVFYFVSKRLLVLAASNSKSPYAPPHHQRAADFSPRGFSPPNSSTDCGRPFRTHWSAAISWSAAFSALFFACHPLRAESVAWLAERRDVLSGLFYLAAVAAYLRYAISCETKNRAVPSHPAYRWYVAALLLCVLSLFSKAIAMTTAVILVMLDVYPLRRLGGSLGWWSHQTHRVWLEKVPFLLLGLAFAVRAFIAQDAGNNAISLEKHGIAARLAQSIVGLAFYLEKTVLPLDLSPLYEIPERSVLLGPMLYRALPIVLVAGVLALLLRRRIPAILASLAVLVVLVSPVLGFAQSGPQLMADRYSYLSCLGIAVLFGGLVLRGLRSPGRPWRIGTAAAASAITLALSWATVVQAALWRDPIELWSHAVRAVPSGPIAHCNLADSLARKGRFDEAREHYERTLALDPADSVALHHMGDLYFSTKQYEKAIEYYRKTVAVNPFRRGVHFALARLLVATSNGVSLEALEVLRDGAARHPHQLEMIDYLADMLATAPNPAYRNGIEAVHWAEKANTARGRNHAPSLLTLASAYAEAGRFENAVAAATQGLALAEKTGPSELAAELRRRLGMFREGKAYHYGD